MVFELIKRQIGLAALNQTNLLGQRHPHAILEQVRSPVMNGSREGVTWQEPGVSL